MTTLHRTVHGRKVHSFEELVNGLGPDAVASPRRSTVPLVDYWRVPEQRLRDFWGRLRIRQPGDTEMHFEHEVDFLAGAQAKVEAMIAKAKERASKAANRRDSA